jgi:hypothetical protein
MASFQTIEQFLAAPFGKEEVKSNEYEDKYQNLMRNKRIQMVAHTQIDDDYLLHLSVGSDTNLKDSYDVVLLFFTDNEELKKERTFRNYYVKFFSNSPSFIYQYAALYKQNGFLIDMLYEKMDQEYADKLPEQTNQSHKMSYDKSIYSACRFLIDQKINAFSKFVQGFMKKKPDEFFREIRDFQDIKMTSEIRSMDRKINKELENNKKQRKESRAKGKRVPSKTPATKINTAKRSTVTNSKNKTHVTRATKDRKKLSTLDRKR